MTAWHWVAFFAGFYVVLFGREHFFRARRAVDRWWFGRWFLHELRRIAEIEDVPLRNASLDALMEDVHRFTVRMREQNLERENW